MLTFSSIKPIGKTIDSVQITPWFTSFFTSVLLKTVTDFDVPCLVLYRSSDSVKKYKIDPSSRGMTLVIYVNDF